MPFVSLARPAIGVSLLKARLAEEGIDCTVGYGSLLFSEWVGVSTYDLFIDQISPAMFAGDWLFSQWLFPERDHSTYIETLRHQLVDRPEAVETILDLRTHIGPFLNACIERFRVADFRIIGFTSTFEQNLASLALAHVIKTYFPNKTIVFGGANCEGIMGRELHRRFPWVDYICSGESDNTFPRLVKHVVCGQTPNTIPGVIYRRGGDSTLAAPPDRIQDMDSLPDPDYTEYFDALTSCSFGPQIRPSLLIETARGCWWGAKSHCTFCGLNGSTMAFRAKSASRVFNELGRQKARYGIGHFLAVDNILSYQYFRDLLPMLKEQNPGVSLFYEIKSNLKREQVELLRDAGVLALQPGIESLNTHVLKLMRKGVTAIQNVQLLRLCKEYGLEIAWNLLYGFPGETPEDYEASASMIPAIVHLKPPGVAAPIRLDRFSPNYDRADQFGLVEVRPFSMYASVYPFPEDVVTNLSYFFEYTYRDGRDPSHDAAPLLRRVQEWRANGAGDLFKRYGSDPELVVEDTRTPGVPRAYAFNGLQREIYDLCDEIQNYAGIMAFATARGVDPRSVARLLDRLVGERLMLQEDQQYLSLAVDYRRRGQPSRSAEPATA